MALVDDDMAVIRDHIGDDTLPNQALHKGDIDVAGGFLLPTADDADLVRRNIQKNLETRQPLIENLPTMDEDQRIPIARCDHLCGDNGLAECRSCCQHPNVVLEKCRRRFILLERQLAEEPGSEWLPFLALVAQFGLNIHINKKPQ